LDQGSDMIERYGVELADLEEDDVLVDLMDAPVDRTELG